jgi:DNA polymerase-3 subunit epsilon
VGGELSARKSWLVNPGVPIPEQSRAVHNITDEMLRSAPSFAQIVTEFEAMTGGHLPVAYNADFDRGFLFAELARAGRSADAAQPAPAFDPAIRWIDPLVWSRELHKDQRGHKLGDVCARLGIVIDAAHRAASDAEATGRVLLALAPRMPAPYGELIRLQTQYAARQSVDNASNAWRRRG